MIARVIRCVGQRAEATSWSNELWEIEEDKKLKFEERDLSDKEEETGTGGEGRKEKAERGRCNSHTSYFFRFLDLMNCGNLIWLVPL